MALHVTLSLIFILTFSHEGYGDMCQFPEFLTASTHWETQITLARKKVDTYIKFHGRIMEEVTFSETGEIQVNRECLQSFEDNKLLFKWTDSKSGDVNYQCFQMIARGGNVMQMKNSAAAPVESNILCSDSSLVLSPWLVVRVSPSKSEKHEDGMCGLSGGYDFHLYDNLHQKLLCEDEWLKPKLEVDCSSGRGMNLNFRNFQCRSTLDMTLQQNLRCLANWEESGYIFSAVTDGGKFWPKVWLLRFPKQRNMANFEIIISSDIIVDTTPDFEQTTRFHRMSVTQSNYPSVCEDEAERCTDCDAYDGFYCQKSCHACEERLDEDCSFPESVRGEWLEVSADGTQYLAITNSILYADGITPLHCSNLPTTTHMGNRNALVGLYKNGCRPRYTCIDMIEQGQNVIQFRLSKNELWPYKTGVTLENVCGGQQFLSVDNPEENTAFKILVRDIPKSSKRPSTGCGIRGTFAFNGRKYGQAAKSQCSGTIKSCDFRDVFRVEYALGCDDDTPDETYHCIASFEDGASTIIITEKQEDQDSLDCWVVHKFEGDFATSIYKMLPGDCNEAAPFAIKYGKNSKYKWEYKVRAQQGMVDEESCGKTPPTSTTTTTPKDKTTIKLTKTETTSMWYITQNIPPNRPTTEKPYVFNESGSGAPILTMSTSLVLIISATCLWVAL